MKKNLYLLLTVLGIILPYYFIFRFFASGNHGVIAAIFQLFTTDMSAAFNADLLFSILVFWVFVYKESKRINMENWWIFLAATLIGLSFALPLFLYFRERHLEEKK